MHPELEVNYTWSPHVPKTNSSTVDTYSRTTKQKEQDERTLRFSEDSNCTRFLKAEAIDQPAKKNQCTDNIDIQITLICSCLTTEDGFWAAGASKMQTYFKYIVTLIVESDKLD